MPTALLAEPAAVTAVWAQVIAWDLFVGRWMYLDVRARAVHPLLMSALLVLTVLLSPIGLPLYLAIRPRKKGVDGCGYLYSRPTAERR